MIRSIEFHQKSQKNISKMIKNHEKEILVLHRHINILNQWKEFKAFQIKRAKELGLNEFDEYNFVTYRGFKSVEDVHI